MASAEFENRAGRSSELVAGAAVSLRAPRNQEWVRSALPNHRPVRAAMHAKHRACSAGRRRWGSGRLTNLPPYAASGNRFPASRPRAASYSEERENVARTCAKQSDGLIGTERAATSLAVPFLPNGNNPVRRASTGVRNTGIHSCTRGLSRGELGLDLRRSVEEGEESKRRRPEWTRSAKELSAVTRAHTDYLTQSHQSQQKPPLFSADSDLMTLREAIARLSRERFRRIPNPQESLMYPAPLGFHTEAQRTQRTAHFFLCLCASV
jgi:hypothetical protein